jgi:putative ABC transport system permease protein
MIPIKRILRSWIRHKLFVAEVIFILAFGLGANIAIFSVYNAAFLQLPYQDPSRILILGETNPGIGQEEPVISVPDFQDWQAGVDAFEATALYDSGNAVVLAAGTPQRISVATVSGNLFSLLGVHPQLGGLLAASETSAPAPEAVISDHLWHTVFGADPQIIGRNIKVGEDTYIVQGVLPPGFKLLDNSDVWVRLDATDEPRAGRHFLALGRLKQGKSLDEAKAEIEVIAARLQKQYASTNKGWGTSVMTFRAYLFHNVRSSFTLLFTTALLVLVVAIFNVANLIGVYLHSTVKDQALELALGCPGAKIRNRLLAEVLLLAIIAGLAGLLVAYLVLNLVMKYAPENLAPGSQYLDLRVYGFAFAAAVLSGILVSVISFVSHSTTNISDILKGVSKGTRGSLGFRSLPRLLFLIFEISMSVVLLITAGLLSKSFFLLQQEDPGFKAGSLLTAKIQLPVSQYKGSEQTVFWDQLLMKLSHVPGVSGVGCMTGVPLSGSRMNFRVSADIGSTGLPVTALAGYKAVSPEALRLLGIPLRNGRFFLDSDRDGSARVVIINETMARNFFHNQNPLGKQLVLFYGDKNPREIVGVVGDVKYSGLEEKIGNQIYVPYAQNPWPFMTLILQTNVRPTSLIPALREEVLKLNKELPLEDVRTMEEIVYASMARSRFATLLIFCFAALALVLAISGLYGVISFAVTQRSREIAVRIALGASRDSVLRLFLTQGIQMLGIGSLLGLVISFFSIQLFQSLLYKVHPVDLQIDTLILCVMLAAGILACFVPARRAASAEPAVIMRGE